jgi:hypothetical protein
MRRRCPLGQLKDGDTGRERETRGGLEHNGICCNRRKQIIVSPIVREMPARYARTDYRHHQPQTWRLKGNAISTCRIRAAHGRWQAARVNPQTAPTRTAWGNVPHRPARRLDAARVRHAAVRRAVPQDTPAAVGSAHHHRWLRLVRSGAKVQQSPCSRRALSGHLTLPERHRWASLPASLSTN